MSLIFTVLMNLMVIAHDGCCCVITEWHLHDRPIHRTFNDDCRCEWIVVEADQSAVHATSYIEWKRTNAQSNHSPLDVEGCGRTRHEIDGGGRH